MKRHQKQNNIHHASTMLQASLIILALLAVCQPALAGNRCYDYYPRAAHDKMAEVVGKLQAIEEMPLLSAARVKRLRLESGETYMVRTDSNPPPAIGSTLELRLFFRSSDALPFGSCLCAEGGRSCVEEYSH